MTAWSCPRCGSTNDHGLCEYCGAERVEPRVTPGTPGAYQPPPARAAHRAPPDERCTEPGCSKTLAEHQAEARAIGLGRTLTVPAMQQRVAEVQRPVEADDEAEHARRRAAQLERFRRWA